MSPKVKLAYFPLKGRGELIRLILNAGAVEYEEETVQFGDWAAKKPTTPLGSLPVLSWDGEELAQSLTIARYVARKCGLAGDNDEEMARADMIAEQVIDVYLKYVEARQNYTKNPEQRKQNVEKYVKETFPNFLSKAGKLLEKNGGKFVTGKSLSYGDLAIFNLLDTMSNAKEMKESGYGEVHGEILEKISKATGLNNLCKEVRKLPRISAYINSRPNYPY